MRAVVAAALVATACGASRPASRTAAPVAPAATPAEAACELPTMTGDHKRGVDGKSHITEQNICCPTDVEAARLAYEAAYDATVARDYEAAFAGYQRAIELDPTFCDAMDNLGLMYRAIGRYDDAMALYARSLKIVPKNPVALQNMAFAKVAAGDLDGAIPYYQKLVALDPRNPEGSFGLGQVYMKQGRTDDALGQFETAHAIYVRTSSPYVGHTHYFLGWLYADKRDFAKARAHFQAAVDLGMEQAREPLANLPPE